MKSSAGRNVMLKLMRFTERLLYKRIKSGFGVNNDDIQNPNNIRLKPLSDSYKKFRSGKIAFATSKHGNVYSYKPRTAPQLGEFGSPGKSNLTLSGQMLNAIKGKLTSKGFMVDIKNTTRKGSVLTNNMVATIVSEERPFLALSVKEQKLIRREYERLVRIVFNKNI